MGDVAGMILFQMLPTLLLRNDGEDTSTGSAARTRCRRFLECGNQWRCLWEEALHDVEARQSRSRRQERKRASFSDSQRHEFERERRLKAFKRKMKVGEVGDARRVLASTPMADRDRNTIIDLSALQPDASMAMPREDAFFAMPKGMSPPQLIDAEAFPTGFCTCK